jgi:hypothetical protein
MCLAMTWRVTLCLAMTTIFPVIARAAGPWQSSGRFRFPKRSGNVRGRMDCHVKSELCSIGFRRCSQTVENEKFSFFHSLSKTTEIDGQPEFLSPFFSP